MTHPPSHPSHPPPLIPPPLTPPLTPPLIPPLSPLRDVDDFDITHPPEGRTALAINMIQHSTSRSLICCRRNCRNQLPTPTVIGDVDADADAAAIAADALLRGDVPIGGYVGPDTHTSFCSLLCRELTVGVVGVDLPIQPPAVQLAEQPAAQPEVPHDDDGDGELPPPIEEEVVVIANANAVGAGAGAGGVPMEIVEEAGAEVGAGAAGVAGVAMEAIAVAEEEGMVAMVVEGQPPVALPPFDIPLQVAPPPALADAALVPGLVLGNGDNGGNGVGGNGNGDGGNGGGNGGHANGGGLAVAVAAAVGHLQHLAAAVQDFAVSVGWVLLLPQIHCYFIVLLS